MMKEADELIIREALLSEAGWISRCQVEMALETESLELVPERVNEGVEHIFRHPETGRYIVAESGGSPVACMLVLNEWSDWRNGEVWWIHSLYVVPFHRRSGVFRCMYIYLRERVNDQENVFGIRLYVDKRNVSAMKTYTALGMSDEHYSLFEWLK